MSPPTDQRRDGGPGPGDRRGRGGGPGDRVERPIARVLLGLIPRVDQRELIAADLDEELSERVAAGMPGTGRWYWGAVLESVADWWLDALSWRSARSRFRPAVPSGPGFRSGGWLADIRFAFRMVRREKIVSVAVILTVTIGVGSTAAVATLLRGVLLRPLPYPDGEHIVRLSRATEGEPAPWPVVGLPDLEDWRERAGTMTAIAGWSRTGATLTGLGEAERISVAQVTPGLEGVLGIDAALGRLFGPDDYGSGNSDIVLLSHEFWTTRLGGDRDVIGETLELDARRLQIVGVLPRSELPYPPGVDAWLTLDPAPESWMRRVRGASWLNAVGRVQSGVPIELAERELSGIQRTLVSEYPRENTGQDEVRLEPLKDVIIASARPAIRIMSGTVGLVLLLASINVGLLLLSRSNRRRQELAVRTVLGGDGPRLTRLLLTETLVLAVIGGTLGFVLAFPLIDALIALYPGGVPRSAEVRLDGGVVALTLVVIALAGMVASLFPALRLRTLDLASQIQLRGSGASRRQGRARSVLVAVQLAVSALLLIGATLLGRTLSNLRATDPGFETSGVVAFDIAPAASRYPTHPEVTAFYRRLLDEVGSLPGVELAGGVNFLPFSPGEWGGGFDVDGITHEARVRVSWPGYYEALGLRLARGRTFDWRDDPSGAAVAMLNASAAAMAFGGEDPMGRVIEFEGEVREIVGILEDVHDQTLLDPSGPEVHVPAAQFERLGSSVVVRTPGDPRAVLPAVRATLASIDAGIPMTSVATMEQRIEASIAPERFRATLVSALGGLSAVLALIGVYGVMSYAVSQRKREIGIRFALGERSGSILRRIVRSAGILALIGVGAGVLVAWGAARWVDGLLFEVSSRDPLTFVVVAGALLAAAAGSALGPAIRASRLDPLLTIREE